SKSRDVVFMNIKNLYCLLLIYSFGCLVFAAEYVSEKRYLVSNNVVKSSSIIYSNSDNRYDSEALQPAIKEIKNKIKENSGDYMLRASLVDLYLKTNQYNEAFKELNFLNNLSMQNKLNENVKSFIGSILENYKKKLRYERAKSDLYVNLAMMSLIVKDNSQAEDFMVSASNFANNTDLLKEAVFIVFDTTGNKQKALAVCDKIIAKNSNDTDIRKLKASYYIQDKNVNDAIQEYIKILSVKPDDTESKYNLYRLLASKNLSEKEIIKRIYNTENPDYQSAYYEIADILLKNNEITDAKSYANILVNKFPDSANGYILLSEIYRKEGKLKESYDALNKVRDKADSNEAIAKYNVILAKLSDEPVREANSLIATGLYQQALDVLDSANQESLYVILTQVRANYLLNQKQKTMELLNKSMSLYPENSDVYCAFGYIYLKEKDIESARKYVNKSLKLNPQNQTATDLLDMVNKAESDTFMNNIVNAYEAQNYSEAMRLIDTAMEINKKDSMLYYYKALIYIAQNNYAASTAALYKCIELDKNNIPAYFYLGIAFDNLSEQKNALTYYQKFLEILPSDDFGESEKADYAKARIQKIKAL
ncbi:MAG: tetratricopeptide repeat protein, partial [Candidatus Gastranaerophilales bacterium]|nr:tetratricopeptide repeat protein [Candidatus Gastranaerophilales bacterium]